MEDQPSDPSVQSQEASLDKQNTPAQAAEDSEPSRLVHQEDSVTDRTPQSVQSLSNSRRLVPYSALRNIYNPRTLLVVASEGCFRSVKDLKPFTEGDHGVLVRLTKKLPLESQTRDSQPIDAIALIYKVCNKDSFETIKASLPYIDAKFFIGKCFILVIIDELVPSSDTEEIREFAAQHRLPLHFASRSRGPKGEWSPLHIPANLTSIYCPRSSSDVNSLLIQASLMHGSRPLIIN